MNKERKFYENISDIVGQADISPARGRFEGLKFSGNFIKRLLVRLLISAIALLLIVYAGDYIVLRYRVAAKRNPFGTVTVDRFYSIAEKNNRTEFNYAGSETQTCVRALFPHLGDNPCWYASRHREQRIEQ
jgi:hypothetical protein